MRELETLVIVGGQSLERILKMVFVKYYWVAIAVVGQWFFWNVVHRRVNPREDRAMWIEIHGRKCNPRKEVILLLVLE